jgi:chromosome segregation ATPase
VIIRHADVAERRLQRLEDRYRRAQLAVDAAKARYRTLREAPAATNTQLLYAQRCVDEAHQYLTDLQTAIEYTEEQSAAAAAMDAGSGLQSSQT